MLCAVAVLCVDASPTRQGMADVPEEDDTLLEQAQQLLSAGNAKEDRGDAAGAVQLYEQVRACGRRIKNVELATKDLQYE